VHYNTKYATSTLTTPSFRPKANKNNISEIVQTNKTVFALKQPIHAKLLITT